MNEALTLLDNLNIFQLPKGLGYSSDSLVDESDETVQRLIVERFDVVRSNIGDELFDQLSYDDKILMANTAGVIDFGHPIDLDKIGEEIENYDYYPR